MSIKSQAAEQLAHSQIVQAFQNSFDDVRTFTNIVLPVPNGRLIKTAEIDTLVVCNAGVFIFEVKSWENAHVFRMAEPGAEKKKWVLRNPSGALFDVRDPVAQGAEKTAALREHLDPRIFSRYFVMLPGQNLTLDGTLPASLFTSADLGYVTRMIRTSHRSQKKFHALDAEAVCLVSSLIDELSTLHTVEEHLAAVLESRRAVAAVEVAS